jgi:Mor family transcriptional regulator
MVKPPAPQPPVPDLVDLIFDYIVTEFPEMTARAAMLKEATRREFSGMETYIAHRSPTERQQMVHEVLRLFNGRNAREVARRLNISRATVYRLIKTAGR